MKELPNPFAFVTKNDEICRNERTHLVYELLSKSASAKPLRREKYSIIAQEMQTNYPYSSFMRVLFVIFRTKMIIKRNRCETMIMDDIKNKVSS